MPPIGGVFFVTGYHYLSIKRGYLKMKEKPLRIEYFELFSKGVRTERG